MAQFWNTHTLVLSLGLDRIQVFSVHLGVSIQIYTAMRGSG